MARSTVPGASARPPLLILPGISGKSRNREGAMTTQAIEIERAILLSYLDDQRGHLLGILEGLDDDTMHRSVLPSGWNCLELVHHLTFDVERFWFQCVAAGDAAAASELPDNAWRVDPELTAEDVIRRYREE